MGSMSISAAFTLSPSAGPRLPVKRSGVCLGGINPALTRTAYHQPLTVRSQSDLANCRWSTYARQDSPATERPEALHERQRDDARRAWHADADRRRRTR